MGSGGTDRMSDPIARGARRAFAPWAEAGARPLLRFEGVSKRFSGIAAVERLGRVLLDGEDLARVAPYRRPVNMMFQSYALFPHLTVEGNVAFGLKQERLRSAEIAARVEEILALVKLEGFAKRKPDALSGGQRQRVALARSLVKRPRILLLDEPLAALDKKLRGETQLELMQLQEKLGLTFIIVTHDQQEAMTVADRIGVMDRGRLIQVAPPPEIYEQPNSRWVADFIGDVNLIEGRVVEAGAGGAVIASAAAGKLRATSAAGAAPGQTVWVALRPEKVRIAPAPPAAAGENCAAGQVSSIGGSTADSSCRRRSPT